MKKIRVLLVDDSPLVRQFLGDIIRNEPDMDLVAVACDGQEGVDLACRLRPDVVTMDVEMPRLNGLQALTELVERHRLPVIMVSSLTSEGAATTLEALEKGAVDFVCKPKVTASSAIRVLRDELMPKIRSARYASVGRRWTAPARMETAAKTADRVVLIAASTGGPRALGTLFECLPHRIALPILLVQHMPSGFTKTLAERLAKISGLDCREAKPGDKVKSGQALVAPGGLHLTLRRNGEIELNDGPPVHGVRPAADLMFASAAKAFGASCLGVVLTGMGRDGAAGALEIRKAGGVVLAESEATCTVFGMPRAAVQVGAVNETLPIDAMAAAIVKHSSGRMARAS